MFESFWPHAMDQDPHAQGRHSPEMQAMGRWINGAEKLVFSRTRQELTWRNSRLLPEFDPGEVEALKNGPGGDIMIFGSGSIVALLTEHRLIDEYRLVVSPVFLGNGLPMLRGMPASVRLELRDLQPHPCGNVTLTYAPAAPPPLASQTG